MSEKREPSRAEQIRSRRRQETQKRQTHSVSRATRPLPIVTSRNAAQVTRMARPRRRFQAAFSMPGIRVHMPSIALPRFEVGQRWFSFFIILLLGAALYLAWTLPTFRVVAASVTGNQRISADEINGVLGSAGQPIFTILPSDLESRLRINYPELASVKVNVGLPNTITVNVAERQPIIAWQQNGGYTWIDANGIAFRPRSPQGADNLISVTALAAPAPGLPSTSDPLAPIPFLSTDMLKAIKTLAANIPSGTAMIYDPHNGLGWVDGRGWQVFFGSDAKDMTLKLQVYQSLITSLTSRGITPAFISVQYVNAPYYRMTK